MKYAAFISYSHKDNAWGERLHRALERYAVPKRLQGQEGRDGPIPARIFPVFRDREELPSSSELNDQIRIALAASATLVVVCSPRAAGSEWVNEEILIFKRLGRANRILALIIDGEPNASEKPGMTAADECFPEALRFRVGEDGKLSDQRVEPVAADARPVGDGEENARLKIIAGILGIGFDQLKQRDLEAQRSRLRRLVAVAGSVAIALTGLLVLSVYFAREARDERNRALRHLGDSYAARAQQFAVDDHHDAAMRTALMAIRLSEGTSALAVEVLRYVGSHLNLRARFPINIHPGARFALSPDARLLVSPVGNDVLAWDTETAALRLTLRGPSRPVRSAEFSRDGNRLLAASEDGTARVWDMRTGQLLGSVGDGKEEVWFARFWQNDGAIVTATSIGRVQIWDASSFRQRATLTIDEAAREWFERPDSPESGMIGGIAGLAVSRDGRKVVLGARSAAAALFVLDDRGRSSMKLLETGGLEDVVLSPDSRRVLALSVAGFSVWDAETGERVATPADNDIVVAAVFSPDGGGLALSRAGGKVQVIGLGSGATEDYDDPEGRLGEALSFSRDGRLIAIARNQGPIFVFERNPDEPQLIAELTGTQSDVQALEFSADGRTLYSSSLDGTVRQWNLATTSELVALPLGAHRVTSVAIAGARVFVSGVEGLRSIELPSMRVTDENARLAESGGLHVSHRRDRIAIGGRVPSVMNAATRDVLQLTAPSSPLAEYEMFALLAWSPDDGVIAGAHGATGIVLWDSHTGRVIREVNRASSASAVTHLAFAHDGTRLILGDANGSVEMWRTDGRFGSRIAGPQGRSAVVAVSPSAGIIVTEGTGGDLRLHDVETGSVRGTLAGHGRGPNGDNVLAVGFSADGRYVHSRSQDDTARIWDVASRSNVLTTDLEAAAFYGCVSFVPGARQVAVNAMGLGTRIFDLSTGQLVMVLQDSAECPAFSTDGRFAAGATYRGAIVWDTSRLIMRAEELVAAACDGGQLPPTARTFTKFEADRDLLVRNLRLDANGREINVCTGQATASAVPARSSR